MSRLAVVIPCFNEPPDRLAETIASTRLLAPLSDVCVIVVDDGSSERAQVPEGVTLVRLPENKGCAAAMNVGIGTASNYSWILRLDCGDTFRGNKVAQVQAAISSGFVASFSNTHDSLNDREYSPASNWQSRIYTDSQFAASASVFNKAVWCGVGGYDESLSWCDDWDFAVKVQAHYGWHYYPHVTADVACHPGGITDRGAQNNVARQKDRAEVVKRSRDLQRGVRL
jgi:glycosyltransferase involved in cell wall biosynthesis